MKKFIKNKNFHTIFIYLLINIFLILFSLIELIWKSYNTSIVLTLSTIGNLFYLLIILFFNDLDKDGNISKTKTFIFSISRFLGIAIGAVASFIFIHFTKVNNYDYCYIFFSIIPIFISIGVYYFRGLKNG